MFWLIQHEAAAKSEAAGGSAHAAAAHHTPVVVEMINHYLGKPVHEFQVNYTMGWWNKYVFNHFNTNAEAVFGPYTPENAIPWYTVMFIIACLLSVAVIWILKGQLSTEDPGHGQQTLESGVLAVRGLIADVVGEHGLKYFPVVATFGVLILISNLMGQLPGLMSPTASTSVTFALGISSFVYYNYIGIKENGLFGHLGHFMGPVLALAPLLFLIEIISNFIRPLSLGIRLFGNIFADEQVVANISNLYPPYTLWLLPIILMPLGLFVAFIQTFIFVFLSIVYISEVSHAPHDDHHDGAHQQHDAADENPIVAPVLT
jgi:F-type H+-transporting ATPase subunit a